ncbi:arabinogalactan endo-beta-1,4-galactanase [Maribacter sp. 2304DJ31-5]|uniref:glycoside hydrolase family 53 protein n=1 Tax=Maribacter sp. 2304DJ31-5 TaxID=3386273 RepID=UPI0039BD16B5
MAPNSSFALGADLSYVNEMEDCGAVFKNSDGLEQDPFQIFKEAGTNLVRVRLWHNPQWTSYSNLDDVKKTIQRAKNNDMQVLLDFHYSDTWADPGRQEIPEAWENQLENTADLAKLLYDYTYDVLYDLGNLKLLPDVVQVGNEINPMILQKGELKWPIDWSRNAALLNNGIKAVRDISNEMEKEIGVMLHIAQPENAIWWFEQAANNGVTDFDWIGLSYYPIWSEFNLSNVGEAFANLITTYEKRLMVVETAYPFTLENIDAANNILGQNALLMEFPATEQGQYNYLKRLKEIIEISGGEGLIYWEPAWVSTGCNTLWGQGSHWDNATLFNHESKPTKGMDFYSLNN